MYTSRVRNLPNCIVEYNVTFPLHALFSVFKASDKMTNDEVCPDAYYKPDKCVQ